MPLLERMRFLCISNSNLDEFFEVQVAILRHHVALADAIAGPDGMSPGELLTRIRARVLELVRAQYGFFNDTLLPELVRVAWVLPAPPWPGVVQSVPVEVPMSATPEASVA